MQQSPTRGVEIDFISTIERCETSSLLCIACGTESMLPSGYVTVSDASQRGKNPALRCKPDFVLVQFRIALVLLNIEVAPRLLIEGRFRVIKHDGLTGKTGQEGKRGPRGFSKKPSG